MTNYNDGEIHLWKGGECPIHPKTRIAVWKRLGAKCDDACADTFKWNHESYPYDIHDIIAFQVVKEYCEPATVWQNKYKNFSTWHNTEESAREKAMSDAIRVAVEYVEVIK